MSGPGAGRRWRWRTALWATHARQIPAFGIDVSGHARQPVALPRGVPLGQVDETRCSVKQPIGIILAAHLTYGRMHVVDRCDGEHGGPPRAPVYRSGPWMRTSEYTAVITTTSALSVRCAPTLTPHATLIYQPYNLRCGWAGSPTSLASRGSRRSRRCVRPHSPLLDAEPSRRVARLSPADQ